MMTPVLFLDDASRSTEKITRERAEDIAKALLRTLSSLRRVNRNFALNTASPISQYQVAEGWTLQAILGGDSFKEEWLFIRDLTSRSPFSTGFENSLSDEISIMEFRTKKGDIESEALAWAALLDSATVGFQANPDWETSWIDTKFIQLEDDGELKEGSTLVKNASSQEHVDEHAKWLREFSLSDSQSASKIWEDRDILFPGIRFLPRVESDLIALEGSKSPFIQAIESIHALSKDVSDWPTDSNWPTFSRKATPEGEQRKALCWVHDDVTNKKELFDWHTRFTANFPGRIHFRVDGTSRIIIIGYIGMKLRREISG